MNLSEHFTLEELTESDYAVRHGLDNHPPVDVVANLSRLAMKLEEVRAIVGRPITVSSGYRSPAVNKGVGGTERSQHCEGLAADIKVAGMRPIDVCRAIEAENIDFDQLIHEYGWTHISINQSGKAPRNMCLTIRGKGMPYIRGIV